MKKTIFFSALLIIIAILFFLEERASFDNEKPKRADSSLKIGYITDIHCYSNYDKDEGIWELNWRCTQPLKNFAEKMNNDFKPDLVIEGGDMADGRDKREEPVFLETKKMYDEILADHYHVLGNHETRGFTKERWLEITGYEKTYYSFDVKGYRIIVLDANHKMNENGEIINTTPNNHYYPGLIDNEQKKWLEGILKNSADMIKIVFVHQPPVESTTVKGPNDLFVNGKELRDLFSRYQVSAVFSGHIEEMCALEYDGVEYYVLQGVHKKNEQLPDDHQFKDQGIFYEIVAQENGEVKVKMYYKNKEDAKYKTMIIDKNTAICNNESVMKPEDYLNLPAVNELEE
jgi:predicted MPP superfamily phosphohydrolase